MEMARAIGWAELIHRRQVELVRLIYSIVGGKSSPAKSATCPGCSRVINPRSSDFPREEARSHKKTFKALSDRGRAPYQSPVVYKTPD
jgi:hypothetical protein